MKSVIITKKEMTREEKFSELNENFELNRSSNCFELNFERQIVIK